MRDRPCPYRLVLPLRRQGLVHVFQAEDAHGEAVIVKQLNGNAAVADPLGKRRFEREIALSIAIDHPGLPRVRDHGRDWVAFECLQTPLSDSGTQKRFASTTWIKSLIAQLAETLAYLHARGIVHRDLKPAHVLFRRDRAVLIDLGIAGLVSNDVLEGIEFVGSPAWMAPEQITGAKPKPSADIWSLCAIGASLLRSAPLFSGSADEVLEIRKYGLSAPWLADRLGDDPHFAALLKAGLGPAETRPRADEIVRALSSHGDVRRSRDQQPDAAFSG